MAERKVLNKYYPPDFNHEKLVKNKRPKDKQDSVRMMLPMSMRCNQCGNYLYIGTKFNMRKETCLDQDYLGIKIHRFYFKCTCCHNEVTFKTDPKNHDYVVEHGATRNYDPWRDAQQAEEALKELREDEEEGNAMKYLENKTYDSKREMDILDALDDIVQINKRKAQVTHEQLLERLYAQYEQEDDEVKAEEQKIKEKFKEIRAQALEEEEEAKNKRYNFDDFGASNNKNKGENDDNDGNKLAENSSLVEKVQQEKKAVKKFKVGPKIIAKKVKTEEKSGYASVNLLDQDASQVNINNNNAKPKNQTKPVQNSFSLNDYSDDD